MSQTYYSAEIKKTTPSWDYLSDDQVKNYLKQDASLSDENTLITALSEAAQSQFEQFTNKALCDGSITARYYELYSESPYIEISLPYFGTYTSVSVSYKYENTTTVLTENTDYYINQNRIRINKTSLSYELAYTDIIVSASITATFDDPNVEPALYKLIGDLYNNRGNEIVGQNIVLLSNNTKALLMPFKDVASLI